MTTKALVADWFSKWETGNYQNLPIAENFKHTSPFGAINGKKAYLDLVKQNEDKFLNQSFQLHDGIYETNCACVRYTARQGDDFSLDVSEWYYINNGLIEDIHAFYHIGEIRKNRELK